MVNMLAGQEDIMRARDGYLQSLSNDNKTTGITSIDEMTVLAVPVLLGICFLVGITSNGALFYTICKSKQFRTAYNGFLLNIVIVNMLLLIVCAPLIATSFVLEREWPFGLITCRIIHSVPQASAAVSMFSLLALSIERYAAFATPPKHRVSAKNRACCGNLVIWIIGIGCGLPLAKFAYEDSYHNNDNMKIIRCRVFNPKEWEPFLPKIHTVVSISFIFAVPIILCIIFYLSLSCVMCGKKQKDNRYTEEDNAPLKNGTRSSRSGTLTKDGSHTKTNTIRTLDSRTGTVTLKRAVRKRRTMAKVAFCLMLQFTIFWAPQWAYFLHWYFYEVFEEFWHLINLIGLVCIYFNAALTPFTVVVANGAFRQHLGKYLCCCFSCLQCCLCLEKSKTSKTDVRSVSDISTKKSAKSSCCLCCRCCHSEQESEEDFEDSLSQSGTSRIAPGTPVFLHQENSNVYQELPNHANYYDSFTIPKEPEYRMPQGPSSERYSHTYAPSDPNRSNYAISPNQEVPYHPSSYHGDEPMFSQREATRGYSPYGTTSRNIRYISDSFLHAQAPKYSRVFQPHRATQLGEATSIRETLAM
ncbi:gastrin-releasing peptide receptor-like [Watersipora subatra]|uniref:gastrin-releasing peptide receptor-like n=1 Tax=Watersipora subatra TaxID=2589382 RepID=UPI00355B4599